MKTILEQLDNGDMERIAKFTAGFYAANPDFGRNPRATERTDARTIYRTFANGNGDASRYNYDLLQCKRSDGWNQYDTDQDAPYFGVWYHMDRMVTTTYCEGDETVVVCHSPEAWKAELKSMADFYGDPPPAFKTLEVVDGQLIETHYTDEDARPEN